jgi:hypothetical protein
MPAIITNIDLLWPEVRASWPPLSTLKIFNRGRGRGIADLCKWRERMNLT